MPVNQAMRETTAADFQIWKVFLDEQDKYQNKQDIASARIAYYLKLIFCFLTGHPHPKSENDLLIVYEDPAVKKKTDEDEARKRAAAAGQRRWLGLFGATRKDALKKARRTDRGSRTPGRHPHGQRLPVQSGDGRGGEHHEADGGGAG